MAAGWYFCLSLCVCVGGGTVVFTSIQKEQAAGLRARQTVLYHCMGHGGS